MNADTTQRRPTHRRWTIPLAVAVAIGSLAGVASTGQWRLSLILLSSLLATASTLPYIRQTLRHQTQPRLVTWGTWSALTAMAAAASFSAGDYPSGVFSLIGTLATAAVVVVALRFGDPGFGLLDGACLALVVTGLGLWIVVGQPGIDVVMACVFDLIGLVPTAVHAWRHPEQETTLTFALIAAAGLAAGLAAWGTWSVTALAYPLYVAVSMGAVALLTLRPGPAGQARPVPAGAGQNAVAAS